MAVVGLGIGSVRSVRASASASASARRGRGVLDPYYYYYYYTLHSGALRVPSSIQQVSALSSASRHDRVR